MTENSAFIDRAIAKVQRLVLNETDLFCVALDKHIQERGRLAWDASRCVFWVKPTVGPPQIALWRMDIAQVFQPDGDKTFYIMPNTLSDQEIARVWGLNSSSQAGR